MIKTLVTTTAAIALMASAALAQTPAPSPAPAAPAAAAAPCPAPAAPAAAGAPSAAGPAITNASCAGAKLTIGSPLKAVMANKDAMAVLAKHIPQVVEYADSNGLDIIPDDFTLQGLLDIAEAGVDENALKAIAADLAKL